MGLFDGLLGGSGGSSADDLYAGLLTPQQLAAIRQRSAGDDLLKLAGAFAQAGQASRLPTGGIGSAIGQAAASLAGSGDEGILKFLQAQKLGAEVLDKKSLAEARKAYLADLLKSGQIPPGFFGGTTPTGGTPGAGGAPGVAGEAPGAPTADFGGDAAAAPAEAGALMSYLVTKHGLSPAAAAGMLGNVGVESNFRPGIVGDKGTSGGLFQHHNERWDSLKQFAQAQGKPWTDPYVQVDFAVQEAKGLMPADWFQSNNPLQAAQQFQDIFERPKDDSGRQRGSIAAGILSRFGRSPDLSSTAQSVTDAQPAGGRSLDQLRGIVAGLQPGGGGGGLLEQAYPNDPRTFAGGRPPGTPRAMLGEVPGAPETGLLRQQLGLATGAPPVPPPSGLLGTGAAAPGPGLPPGVPRFPDPRVVQGTSGSSAQAGSYSPDFFVGDSLSVQAANAYRQQGGNAQVIAKSGISPQAILDNVNQALAQNPDTFRGKNVVVTSGSNDVGQLAQVEETVQRLRAAGANVTLGGVSNEHSRLSAINPDLQEIASRQGASFAPLPSTQGDRELVHAYGRQPEFLSNIRRANAARSGGEGSTPDDLGAGGDPSAAAVLPAGAGGAKGSFADSGLVRGGASIFPSSGGGPLAAPMPAGPPAAAAAPVPGAGPLAAPVAPGPGPAGPAPGPGGLLTPTAPPTPPSSAPVLPPAPASNPEMQRYIYDIARKGALAELAGLPNAYAPLLSALQGSPQYKAIVEAATTYARESTALGFAKPKAAAEAEGKQPYDLQQRQYQSQLDREREALARTGGAELDVQPYKVPDGRGGVIEVPLTRKDAADYFSGRKDIPGLPPLQLGGAGPQTQLQPGAGAPQMQPAPAAGPMRTGVPVFTPGQIKQQEARAGAEETARTMVQTEAETARDTRALLLNMQATVGDFPQGASAPWQQTAAQYLRLVNPSFDKQVASYEDFIKNGETLVRQAVRSSDSNPAAVQFPMIRSSLPSPETSPQGLRRVMNELIGSADYKSVRAAGQAQYENANNGSTAGFTNYWQKNTSPYAFIVMRMDPVDRKALFDKLETTDAGKREMAKIGQQVQFITQNGLQP